MNLFESTTARSPIRSSRECGHRTALAVLIAVVLVATAGPGGNAQGAEASDAALAARARGLLEARVLRGLAGDPWRLADFRGEVVVVNFWASWCRPCRQELPALDALNAEIARHGGRVFAISIDTDAANVRRFIRSHKLSLPILHDGPNGLASVLELDRIPYTLVLDRNGDVAFATSGLGTGGPGELEAVVRRLVQRPHATVTGSGGGR